jgi:hypothetical protein
VIEILKEKADAKNIVLEYNFDDLEYNTIFHDELRIK